MQIDDIVQVGQRGSVGGAGPRGAGVVHETDNVERAGDFAGDFLRARFIGQIGLIRDQTRRRILGQLVVDVDDLVAGIEQHADDGGADPGAAAGDEICGGFGHINSRSVQKNTALTIALVPPQIGDTARSGSAGLQVSPPGGRAQARTGGLNGSDSPMPILR